MAKELVMEGNLSLSGQLSVTPSTVTVTFKIFLTCFHSPLHSCFGKQHNVVPPH